MKKINSYFKPLKDLTNTPPKTKKSKNVYIDVKPPVFEIPSSPTTNSSSTVNSFFPQIINSTSTMFATTAAALENPVNNFLLEKTKEEQFENDSNESETVSVIDISDDEVLKPDLAHKSAFSSNNSITMTKYYQLKVNGIIVDTWMKRPSELP